jgi:hypothetical protein
MFLSRLGKTNSIRRMTLLNNHFISAQCKQFSQILKAFATIDPDNMNAQTKGYNLVGGEWKSTKLTKDLIDPMNGNVMA